jgi:hypothetical protein
MTGADHYRKAERLVQDVTERGPEWSRHGPETVLAIVQVHAALALAAATALGTAPADRRAWTDAAGTKLSDGA